MRSDLQAGRTGRGRIVVALALLAGTIAVFANTASAVRNTGAFELEGDATTATSDDWDEVCYAETNDSTLCGTSTAATADEVGWSNDGALNASIFVGGGSKDPLPIEGWAWKDEAGGLPDKDNLLHAFAARYSLPPDADDLADPSDTVCNAGSYPTCELLYFGSDRYDNSGDAHQAFWFLQGQVGLGSNKIGGGTGFTGSHVNGDLLVVSEFSNGGSKSTIKVWKWDTTCAKAGGTCADQNLRILAESDAASCTTAAAGAAFCGVVNGVDDTPSPWPFVDKSGNNKTYLQGEFFEAGINLSDPSLNLADQCFSTVVAETRSSTASTATLKDFVIAPLGSCGSSLVTTPSNVAGTPIGAGGISVGTGGSVQVKDAAMLTVSGTSTWAGTLDFYLCGPIATGTCDAGGLKIGGSTPVTQATGQPILSPTATVTGAGRYCWRGVFTSSTTGLPNATDSSSGECFVVNPVTPTLSTQAVNAAGEATNSVPLGSTIYDTATLAGTANRPGTGGGGVNGSIDPTTPGAKAGGTINFKLYGPGIGNCTTLAAGFPAAGIDVSVTNGDGTYGGSPSVSHTPTAAGDYYWKATYGGDTPNTNSTAQHNADCSVANEKVTVVSLQPTIGTNQSFVPNDSATISVVAGGGNLAGTVVFKLYVGAANDCTGVAAYQSGAIDITSGTGSGMSRTVTSANTISYNANTSFKWVVEFTSTNPSHKNVTSACGTEISNIVINNNATP